MESSTGSGGDLTGTAVVKHVAKRRMGEGPSVKPGCNRCLTDDSRNCRP
jgi:hypothetical protein